MNAAQLHYERIETRGLTFEVATAGEGDRLALLLHGFPESAHSYRHQFPLFTRLGYRVWAPNMRGYGRSDKPKGRLAYGLDKLERDVTDLIDASGARSVLLVGHDWGGVVAWSYAQHGARPLERLVVMNAPHPRCFQAGVWRPAQLKRSWYMFFFQLPWLPERLLSANGYEAFSLIRRSAVHRERFSDDDLAVLRRNAAAPGSLTAMLNYYRALPLSPAMARPTKPITIPTLLLWGEQDGALGKELTYGTERYVENLTLRYVPDASHWIQQDVPDTVNAAIEAWLLTEPAP